MSREPTRTDVHAGDFISENAVRGVFARRRQSSPTTPVRGAGDVGADRPEDTSRRADRPRRLRRWSVAELIARSVAPPQSTR